MAETKHTPTPWYKAGEAIFQQGTGAPITDALMPGNAPFIVRAVNAHQGLTDELEKAADSFDDFCKAFVMSHRPSVAEAAQIAATSIRAALAKARGE